MEPESWKLTFLKIPQVFLGYHPLPPLKPLTFYSFIKDLDGCPTLSFNLKNWLPIAPVVENVVITIMCITIII